MALLTATPNPIEIYRSGDGSTMIHWDAQSTAFNGIVYFSIDGATPAPRDNGGRRGDLPLKLTLGQSCVLTLRRADNPAVILETLTVTTRDIQWDIAAGFSQSYVPQLKAPARPQMITNLSVRPGVDTVRVKFRTVVPTIPTVGLFDANGAYIDGRMPLFGGLQKRHEFEFGMDRPLALGAKHLIVIEAFGATHNPSSPNKAVHRVEFVSGTRSADVAFETVNVHDDSDPGLRGAGEFQFSFGVGDRATRAIIGPPVFMPDTGSIEIDHDDPPTGIGKVLPIPSAPRLIWAQVVGTEGDQTILPGEIGFIGRRPTFDEEGVTYFGNGAVQQCTVSASFDLSPDSGRFAIPFDMATGPHSVDYVVSGHIFVRATNGEVISGKMAKVRPPYKPGGYLTEPGDIARLAASGPVGRGHIVARGADGALHISTLSTDLQDARPPSRVELPFDGTIAACAATGGGIDLYGINADGGLLHCRTTVEGRARPSWKKLGGELCEVHSVPGAGNGSMLAGIGRDGSLRAAIVRDGKASWDRLAEGPIQALTTIDGRGGPGGLVAISADGDLTHVGIQRGRWKAQSLAAHLPEKTRIRSLTSVTAATADPKSGSIARDVIVGALGEDLSVWLLKWPDYPNPPASLRWEPAGPLQELTNADASSGAAAKVTRKGRSPAEGKAKERAAAPAK